MAGGGEARPAGGLDRVALESKLRGPRVRPGTVSRAPVIERARASRAKVVNVAAPAGYGKSTMLAEWAATEPREVAWVTLDESDDDPAALLWQLAGAAAPISPAVAGIVEDMRDIGGSALARAAPLLAHALSTATAPFVLFIDDTHTASSPGCSDVLDVILPAIPDGSQVVMAGRHDLACIARLRTAGDVFEVDVANLCIGLDGAQAIFDQAGVTEVSQTVLSAAVERCEGWPAGIALCALIARDGSEVASAVAGNDRLIADYLYHQCLERLPDRTQRFLRRTAVLEQLSAGACDAVLGADDSQDRLRELEAANLFVVPLDRHRTHYRYHALFREHLLAELHRREASQVSELHRRAANWHEAAGHPTAAIEHHLTAGNLAEAARLVAATALPMYLAGQVGVVTRWLSTLGEAAVVACPELMVLACWASLLTGQTAQGQRWAHLIAQTEPTGEPDETLEFESARAQIRVAMSADGAERALADATFGYTHEPVWSPWRDQAVYLYGSALLLNGDVDGARAAFTEAGADADTGERNTDCVILSESELTVLAIDADDWPTAARHAQTALEIIDANHLASYVTSALAFAVGARVALHDGDLERAEQLVTRAMRIRTLCTYVIPVYALRVRLQLAKAHIAIGDRLASLALTQEMDDILRHRPDLGVLADEVAAYRRELAALPETTGSKPLTPAELRVLPYLQTHLTLHDIASRLHTSRNTVNSQVASIYRKLGIRTRRAAVQRATEVGLLGD